VTGELDGIEFFFGDFQPSLVDFLEVGGGDFQTSSGCRAANETEQNRQRDQNETRPGCRNLAEESMLDQILF